MTRNKKMDALIAESRKTNVTLIEIKRGIDLIGTQIRMVRRREQFLRQTKTEEENAATISTLETMKRIINLGEEKK